MADLFEQSLKRELDSVDKVRKVSFAITMCERMVPALDKFSKESDFDNSIYHASLDCAWDYLKTREISCKCNKMIEECLGYAPDTDEFNHPLTSAALNAALSIAATVSFLADDYVDHIVEIAGLARDTAALCAQTADAKPPRSLGYDEIIQHPLVLHELGKQAEDLQFVKALPTEYLQADQLISLLKERTRT